MGELLPGIREALEAMNRGDVEPSVSLLDERVEWRGPTRGHLWWKHTPSCHGPHEARENFKLQVRKGNQHPGARSFTLEQLEQVGDRLVLGGRWTTDGGSDEEAGRFFQVLTVRNGRIVDIQGCRSHRAALRYLRRAAR
jgi:ketosteroid isomerase-like protein